MKLDLTDHVYGRLTVLREAEMTQPSKWVCRCECGTIKTIIGASMRNGSTKSCGCLHIESNKALFTTHGGFKTKLFSVHQAMLRRCTTPTHCHYPLYGGRGITVCPAWMDFLVFKEWADANGYSDGLSLDRRDNDLGYSPDNCRWATGTTQSRNRNAQLGKSSKFIGVTWDTKRSKWFVSIGVNKKTVALGRFTEEIEAARARDAYIIQNGLQDFVLNFK